MPDPVTEGQLEGVDGTPLHTRTWPSASPRAVALVVHGLFEHAGRYGHVAEALRGAGLTVTAYDQRGHGRSGGPRGLVPSVELLLDDLALVVAHVRARHNGLPLVLLGHSLGGMVAALWAAERGVLGSLAALVLSAPYLGRRAVPGPAVHAARALGRLAPRLPTLAVDPADVSRDPAVVAAYRADPLVYSGRIPAATGAMMLSGAHRVRAAASALPGPLLLLQGGADRLTSPEAARHFYENAGAEDKTLEFYGSFFHEVFNEPARAHVLADLVRWLDARLPPAA